jgi:hypothetical protein
VRRWKGFPILFREIRRTRVKALSRAVDIEYDPDIIPFDLWEDLAAAGEVEGGGDGLVDRIRKVLRHQVPVPLSDSAGEYT